MNNTTDVQLACVDPETVTCVWWCVVELLMLL